MELGRAHAARGSKLVLDVAQVCQMGGILLVPEVYAENKKFEGISRTKFL